jgi:hypothetical protein
MFTSPSSRSMRARGFFISRIGNNTTIVADHISDVPLTVASIVSGTANIIQIANSSTAQYANGGSVFFSVNSTGYRTMGNSTVNAISNSSILYIVNSTVNSTLTPVSLFTGNSTVNVTVNSSAYLMQNSTVNAAPLWCNVALQVVNGGVHVSSINIGIMNSTVTTVTVDHGKCPLQYLTNNGAFTFTATTTSDGSCVVQMQNGTSAGTVTFSGYTTNATAGTGDALNTVSTNKFNVHIVCINAIATYVVKQIS